MLGFQRMPTPYSSSKTPTKARNDRKWETHKDNIRSVYMDMDHTLKETMKIMGDTYHFTASERKWKEKLKEWKFEKNIPAAQMSILVAKYEKRKRSEGKDTKFFHGGAEIKSERFENFKKRKTTKVMDVASPAATTPADITYCTPGPQTPFIPMNVEDISTLDQQAAKIEHLDYVTIADDISGFSAGTQKTSNESSNVIEGEIPTFLPYPSHQSGERHMLIETISPSSMLWNCHGRGLHTIDEESVIGLDDEILAPFVASDLVENHIREAQIDFDNCRTKSAIVKYLGAIILVIERKCCSEETLLEYFSGFLDLLEVEPGAYVSALQQSPERPIFRTSEYSDVFLLYHEVLTLLRNEFQPTTEVVARICLLLADLETLYPEMSHHAETLYSVAIEGYEKVGKFDHLLQCQLSLADVLVDLNRSSDAYELLARACGKYLQEHLDLWIDEKPTTIRYTLASLFPASPGVRPSIFRIKRILSQKLETPQGSGDNYDLYVMMIHEIAALGGILSIEANQSEFFLPLESLDPLWSELFAKLLSLDDTIFALVKAFAYIQRSNYLSNGFNPFHHPNCLDDIATAHRYLSEGGHLREDLKDQLVQHVEGLRSRAVNHPQVQFLDDFSFEVQILDIFSLAGMSRDPSDVSRPLLGTPQLQPSLPEDLKDTDDLFESATISRKYGVRYNDSNRKGLCFTDWNERFSSYSQT